MKKFSNKTKIIILISIIFIAIIGLGLEIKLLVFNNDKVNDSLDNKKTEENNNIKTHNDEVLKLNLGNNQLQVDNTENPTILFASDYQGYERQNNARSILNKIKEVTIPNLLVFCGDYQEESSDKFYNSEAGILEFSNIFNQTFNNNIPLLFVQGNHDITDAYGIAKSGMYETSKYIVYVINKDDYSNNQAGVSGGDSMINQNKVDDQEEIVKNTSQKLQETLQNLKENNDKRPIFISTHVPLHYTNRNDGTDNKYAKYMVDVLNEYGKYLNIIYLYGHNHSGDYDDYIGGSINYIAKGNIIKIGGINVDTTINFTYLNAGYMGYSNNSINEHSVNITSATTITIDTDKLLIQKYTRYGKYYNNPISVELKK